MTPRPSNAEELLSACCDGELSPAERAELEQLLEGSPVARETLDDFRELSSLLRSVGRPRAPEQLLPTVRQTIAALPAAASAPPRRRTWLWWAGPLLATAATLFLMVQAGRFQPESRDMADGVASSHRPLAEGRSESPFSSEGDRARRFGNPTESLLAPRMAAAPVPEAAAAEAAVLGGVVDSQAMTGASAADALNLAASAAGELIFDHARPPAVSDVLAHVARVGDQTVIVDLEVVNVDRAADDMLVLLRQNGVRVVGESPASPSAAANLGGRPLSNVDQEALVAVYVEASDEQLAAVVNDVLAQVSVTEATVRNFDDGASPLDNRLQQMVGGPVDAASLPPPATAGVAGGERPRGGQTLVIPQAPPPASPLPRRPELSQSGGQPGASAPSAGPSTNAPPAARDWGMKLPLPANLYNALEARANVVESQEVTSRNAPAQAKRGAADQRRVQIGASSAGQPAAEAALEPAASPDAVRRVLFVIQAAPQN